MLRRVRERCEDGLCELDELDENAHILHMKQELSSDTNRATARSVIKRFPMRDARTGQFLTVPEQMHRPMPKHIGRALSLSNDSVELVLEALHAAASKSRSVGTALQFVVEVKPDGTPQIVEAATGEERKTAALDASLEMDAAEEGRLERALVDARERGRHAVADILSDKDMLSADAFAAHLQTTRATINSWRQAHQVLGLQGATRGYRYPVWQIGENGRPFARLPKLFEIFGDSPWAVFRFLVQPHSELDGVTGREALQRGWDDRAISVAQGISAGTFV